MERKNRYSFWNNLGRVWVRDETRVHQVSYMLAKGNIKDGLSILHSCDNGLCQNPKHLSQDTHQQNMQDSVDRGRRNQKGFGNSRAILTEQEAISIFYVSFYCTVTIAKIAKLYKLSEGTIANIVHKRHWATRNL